MNRKPSRRKKPARAVKRSTSMERVKVEIRVSPGEYRKIQRIVGRNRLPDLEDAEAWIWKYISDHFSDLGSVTYTELYYNSPYPQSVLDSILWDWRNKDWIDVTPGKPFGTPKSGPEWVWLTSGSKKFMYIKRGFKWNDGYDYHKQGA